MEKIIIPIQPNTYKEDNHKTKAPTKAYKNTQTPTKIMEKTVKKTLDVSYKSMQNRPHY